MAVAHLATAMTDLTDLAMAHLVLVMAHLALAMTNLALAMAHLALVLAAAVMAPLALDLDMVVVATLGQWAPVAP